MRSARPLFAVVMLVLCWLGWGFSYPATSTSLQGFDVWTLRSLSMLPSGLIMLAIAAANGGRIGITRPMIGPLLIAAALNITLFQVCMAYGITLMSSGRTAVIVYTMPLWAALFAAFWLGERITAARVAALALGLAGIAVLMSQDLSDLENAPLGAASTLVSAIAFGAGTVWVKRFQRTLGALDMTALGGWQLVLGGLPVLALWPFLGTPTDLFAVPLASWIGLAYVVLIANVLAYAAWFRVVQVFPATVSGLGSLAVPIVGVFSSALILSEQIGWREIAALTLVCAALAIVLFEQKRG